MCGSRGAYSSGQAISMVCPTASGKMAVLTRSLMGDGLLQSRSAEEVGDHKMFAQDIYREFCEADEANLLNEEDMHIFGLKPLTDELHLVSCNACKKPIMASQYLAHAEICKLLGSSFEATPEYDAPARSNKPPRKERRRSISSTSRKSADVDNGCNVNGSEVAPQNGGYSKCSMPPPIKRPKFEISPRNMNLLLNPWQMSIQTPGNAKAELPCHKRIADHHSSERDDPGMMSGQMRVNICEISPSGREMLNDYPVDNLKSTEVKTNGQICTGILAPLASKIYYSQRNSRLRLLLADSNYSTVATKGLSSSLDPLEQFSAIPPEHDPILVSGSELLPDTSLGCVQTSNESNNLSDTALRPEDVPFPLVGNNLSTELHSFAGDSGNSLRVQQTNGSISVS